MLTSPCLMGFASAAGIAIDAAAAVFNGLNKIDDDDDDAIPCEDDVHYIMIF